MKNLIAVFVSFLLFTALFLAHLFVSFHFLSEERPTIDNYVADILQPIFVVLAGYFCVKLSSIQKWWFSGVFAITTYILLFLYVVFFGPGLDLENFGLAGIKVPAGLAAFSLLGGGLYQYVSAKH